MAEEPSFPAYLLYFLCAFKFDRLRASAASALVLYLLFAMSILEQTQRNGTLHNVMVGTYIIILETIVN